MLAFVVHILCVCVCQCARRDYMLVCVYTYIHMCLLFSVCLRPSSQLARGHVCALKRI